MASGATAGQGGKPSAGGTLGSGGVTTSGGKSGLAGSSGAAGDCGPGCLSAALQEGLELWFAADDRVLVSQAGSVTRWVDLAGAGNRHNDMEQNLAELQPVKQAEWRNGKPALRFQGGQFLTVTQPIALDLTRGVSVFAVVESDFEERNCPPVIYLSNNGPSGWTDAISLSIVQSGRNLEYEVNERTMECSHQDFPPNTPVSIAAIQDAHYAAVYVNGNICGDDETMPIPASVPRQAGQVAGGYPDCSRFKGYIAEILFYARSLSEAERVGVQAYLDTKWGLR